MNDEVLPRMSVIVPAYRCTPYLRVTLDALERSTLPRDAWELIVVDDSSGDDTADFARTKADLVLTTDDGPRGPGCARNLGARQAHGDVVVFVDADVVVAPETLALIDERMQDRNIGAVFGSYDAFPSAPGLVSQYRNLLHHYVHHQNAGHASTFWAGCGAIRRTTFLKVGGFDEQRYPRPQIEDIELGYRLRAHGETIVLDPRIQGKHLKQWTLSGMIRTDLRERAIPWMHLLIERHETLGAGPLNLHPRQKVLTVVSCLALLLLGVAAITLDSRWLLLVGALAGLIILGDLTLFLWFSRARGPLFASAVVPLRWAFYVVSGVGATWAILTHRWRPQHPPPLPLREALRAQAPES